jgi:sugar phosphate isomerase/epimerase
MQYATQLYSLRALPAADRCRAVAEAGFTGVELVGVDPPEGLAAHGLDVAAAHVDVETVAADPGGVVERVRTAGTDTVVVPIVAEESFRPGEVDETATRLDALAGRVEDAGGRLLYHNHEFEFASGTFERVVDATTRLGFELDVGWARAAGADPVSLVERVGERMPLVHLKDVRVDSAAPRGAVPVDLGVGDVDLGGVLAAAAEAGVDWVVFEHDDPAAPARTVRAAADWLSIR